MGGFMVMGKEGDDMWPPLDKEGKRTIDFKCLHSHGVERVFVPPPSSAMDELIAQHVKEVSKFYDNQIALGYLMGKIAALEERLRKYE